MINCVWGGKGHVVWDVSVSVCVCMCVCVYIERPCIHNVYIVMHDMYSAIAKKPCQCNHYLLLVTCVLHASP